MSIASRTRAMPYAVSCLTRAREDRQRLAGHGGALDVGGAALHVQPGAVDEGRRFGHVELEGDRIGLALEEAVGDAAPAGLRQNEVQRGLAHAELRSPEHERQDRDERGAVGDLLGMGRRVLVLDGLRHRERPVLGDEDLVGDQRVAASALHAGYEPRVLDRQVGHRRHRQRLVDHLAALVGDQHADQRPVGVQAARRVGPASGDLVAAVDLADVRRWVQDAGDARARVLAPDVLLGLVGEHAAQPVADVDERQHPPRRAVALADRRGDLHLGPDRDLVAAEAPRHRDLEQPGVGERLDALVGDPALGVGLGGVALDDRADLSDPVEQLLGPGRLRGGVDSHWSPSEIGTGCVKLRAW
jgi:hypothetical protein